MSVYFMQIQGYRQISKNSSHKKNKKKLYQKFSLWNEIWPSEIPTTKKILHWTYIDADGWLTTAKVEIFAIIGVYSTKISWVYLCAILAQMKHPVQETKNGVIELLQITFRHINYRIYPSAFIYQKMHENLST